MIQESRFRFLLILCILVSVLIKGASIDKCFVTFGFSVIGSHYQTTMTDEDTIRKKSLELCIAFQLADDVFYKIYTYSNAIRYTKNFTIFFLYKFSR